MLGLLLVGGGALAQQGVIVDPWRRPAVAPAPAELVPKAVPASGLPGPSTVAAASRAHTSPVAAEAPAPGKWSPPVVELLVDPWSRQGLAAPQARPRWVPQTVEVVDPWATETPAPPHAPGRPTSAPHAAIF
jgi:hypothetical protein